MIHPNVIIYSKRSSGLITGKSAKVTDLPLSKLKDNTDRCVIDQIRAQPKPNNISKLSSSEFSEDVSQMVELLGSQCKKNSISEMYKTIEKIHNTLNDKSIPEIKNWIRIMTGMHPAIDKKLKKIKKALSAKTFGRVSSLLS